MTTLDLVGKMIPSALIAALTSACGATAAHRSVGGHAGAAGSHSESGGTAGVGVGGTMGSGGSVQGTGGSDQGTGGAGASGTTGNAGAPSVNVGICEGLGAVGQWQAITPPQVPLPGAFPCDYGIMSFVMDPINLGTVIVGSCQHGIYKTTDCGANWTHINTGKNGSVLDYSRQWTFVIDPVDPRNLYTNVGYAADGTSPSGALKSTDGGVNWEWIWPSADPTQAGILERDFVSQINMDPTNRMHLVMGFHGCKPPLGVACFGETQDGGATWTIQNGDPSWGSSEAQTPYAVTDHILLFDNHDSTSGRWVSTNSGETWTMIAPDSAGHWPAQLYRASSGYYYMGNNRGIMRSADGATWSAIADYKGGMVTGLVGDGTTMWAANWGSYSPWMIPPGNPYVSSPETDGLTWTPVPWTTPAGFDGFTQGGVLAYDPAHHVLYSANGTQGFWRVVTH
jgi:hypothetical protein